MKIIAFYLPQFHSIPENDAWWGKNFTEWENVKKARPLFNGHKQPKTPQSENYYNLLDYKVLQWQANLAKDAGLYGFCIYHYWFNGHMLLEKPMEMLLQHPEIDLNYCISWANEDWTKAWVGKDNQTLISQNYGEKKEWEEHFNYFNKFFKDKRYITENGKPILVIYRPELIPCLKEMLEYWKELAKKSGLEGIKFAYQHPNFTFIKEKDDSCFDYAIEYQPAFARRLMFHNENSAIFVVKRKFDLWMQKVFHRSLDLSFLKGQKGPSVFYYDEVWATILNQTPLSGKSIPGAFVNWDNTPRRGKTGSVAIGATPEKFKEYIKKQIIHAKTIYHKDMIFIFAWNEWAEGGYLEPDFDNGNRYLSGIREALIETSEEVER